MNLLDECPRMPSARDMLQVVAEDPVAQARFFHPLNAALLRAYLRLRSGSWRGMTARVGTDGKGEAEGRCGIDGVGESAHMFRLRIRLERLGRGW